MENKNLLFRKNKISLTLGVEMELQVLDNESLHLKPKAPDILKRCRDKRITKEMFQSTLELVTGVCNNVHEIREELQDCIQEVKRVSSPFRVCFASTGTNPWADYNERVLTARPRYHQLLDRNQWLIRRMAVYGLHVHIGMRDGNDCIRFNNFFLQFVPHLIALSASSPFWTGRDTGLCASRPTVYESHPTSGIPYLVKNWNEFNKLYKSLLRTKSIESMKDIWWDLRPSPVYGTLEIRICDAPATLMELQSIVAFIHTLAHWFRDHQKELLHDYPLPQRWILRENKWRAIRYGLDAEIIENKNLRTTSLRKNILYWLKKLDPYFQKLDYNNFQNCILKICEIGNSTDRQRKVMRKHNDLYKVIEFNVREFEARKPLWRELN